MFWTCYADVVAERLSPRELASLNLVLASVAGELAGRGAPVSEIHHSVLAAVCRIAVASA
jgi:hypothetical protein